MALRSATAFPWRAAVLVIALGALGCAETAKLRGGITTARAKVEQVERNGAYVCAPRELAMAKAHLDFAELEIGKGMGKRAREHYLIAVENLARADEKSPPDKCAGPAVVVAAPRPRPEPEPEPEPDPELEPIPKDQDLDGDGIPDYRDQCPLDAEDFDGYLDDDGCPDLDNDADGIPDYRDKCPNDPEDPDGFEDDDGCPDLDNDGDGIPDLEDECPFDKGDAANKGCPRKYEGVEITETHIRIDQVIHFAFNKATIMKRSFPILEQVARVLEDHPEITLSIEGHTDSRGRAKYNKQLSTARARSVVNHLVKRGGIERHRLTHVGWGQERPIESNLTEEGRAANRRVEFVRTDVRTDE